jgi:hypothetical protein
MASFRAHVDTILFFSPLLAAIAHVTHKSFKRRFLVGCPTKFIIQLGWLKGEEEVRDQEMFCSKI